MQYRKLPVNNLSLLFIFYGAAAQISAQPISITLNADFVSRYIWQGINLNDAPNIQPSITMKVRGLQCGFWGSYGLTHLNSIDAHYNSSQEIDTWGSYTIDGPNKSSLTAIITDYYFANSGIRIGNFNNYNNKNGPGAHIIEAGLTMGGPESFPILISGCINVYNDKGNNMYIYAEYGFKVDDASISIFTGTTPGSQENPLYNTDRFSIINIGLKASKQIKISESYSIPVYCSYILNPNMEISYLVFGITL
ncbi:MAG: hypothetical protein P4L27_06610 [Ignavibacteriaceae bacterium]|nr:hypothetical protein [Ignavibacteriaceae bacterium]